MALSSDLVSQFIKTTNDKPKASKEETVYGTVVEGGVKLDGSEIVTPMTTYANMQLGDRVRVSIKNHTAYVVGNASSPAARIQDVDDVNTKVDENTNNIKQVNNDITQINNVITEQGNNIELINNDLLAKGNTINLINNTLTAHNSRIETVESTIETHNSSIETINSTISTQGSRIDTIDSTVKTQGSSIETLNSSVNILNSSFQIQNGVVTGIKGIDTEWITTEQLEADSAKIIYLTGEVADFKTVTTDLLDAHTASIDDLYANKLSATDADIKYANIDFSNIGKAAMEYFYANSGLIKNVVVGDQTLTGELVGVTIKGDLIEGNTIIADKLVIKGEDGLYYKLNTDGITTEAEQTDYNSLNGQVICARSITATKIAVEDLVAFGATIGGFKITDNSIYSGVKESVDNGTRGIYLDSTGQIAFGDGHSYIKYYKDTDGTYKLAISAEQITMGGSSTNISDEISAAQTTANNAQLNIDSANARIDTLVTRTDSLGQSLTSVTQTADKINWLVKSGTSSSDFTLTDRTATLVSDYINLNGSVTFNGLNSDTRTKITNGNNAYVWTNTNGSNMTNLLSMVKKWTGNAVSDTTTINGGWIGTNTITANKIAVGDFTNYALVNKNNADKYGFTVVADSSDSNNPWLQLKTLNRDTDLTGGGYTKYKCNGGETFRIKFEVSSTVQGTLTGDSSGTRGYLIIGVGLYGKRTDGSNFWLTPQSYRSDASGTIGAVNTTLTLPSNAREFGVYLLLNGYNFTGTCKVRNISVMKMSSGELIVDGSITADKINVTDLTSLGATIGGWNINSGGISKVTGTKGVYVLNGTDSNNNYLVVNELNSDGSWKSSPFYVRSTGQMYAANATIKGSITATSGKIGSFNINSSLYTNSNALIYTGSSGNIYLGSDGIGFGRSYLTSAGGMSLQGYDGTTGQIEGGNISLFAGNGGDNPYLEATAGTSLTNSSLILRCPTTLNSTLTANSGLTLKNAGVELYFSTPYIDFHFNNSTSDYTSRIIEQSSGVLTMTSSLTVEKTATISGGRLYVEGLGRKIGLAAQDADKVGLYDYTNSKWLIYSENDSSEPIKINTKLSVGNYSNSNYAISCSSFICEGWVRTKTGKGWYNEDHGGGWYMSDNTWIRSYGSKSIYQDSGTLRTDGTLQVGPDGAYFKSNSTNTTIKTLFFEDYSGKNRKPVSSVNGDGDRVAVLSSGGGSYLTVSGQWGTTGSTYSTKKFAVASSDIRLKENISDATIDALPIINQIRIRQFDWRRDHSHQAIGMVADEVELIDSKFAIGGGYDDEGNMDEKIVDTFYMMGYVVKGIQEICSSDNERDRKIQSNEARVDSLQTQLNEAMNQIAELKKLVELLTA